jgi:hypothetical protein
LGVRRSEKNIRFFICFYFNNNRVTFPTFLRKKPESIGTNKKVKPAHKIAICIEKISTCTADPFFSDLYEKYALINIFINYDHFISSPLREAMHLNRCFLDAFRGGAKTTNPEFSCWNNHKTQTAIWNFST